MTLHYPDTKSGGYVSKDPQKIKAKADVGRDNRPLPPISRTSEPRQTDSGNHHMVGGTVPRHVRRGQPQQG